MQALEDWNAKYGSDEDFTKATKKGGGGFPFVNDVTYGVRVKSAKTSKSTRSDRQITLSLAILNPAEEEVGKHTVWLTLPKQPETDGQHDAEKVRKWTFRRRDDLGRILGNVDKGKYGLYYRKEQEGENATYFDKDGNRMSKDDLDRRQVEVNRAIMEFVDTLHSEFDSGEVGTVLDMFEGAEFYIVRAENKTNPKYPYTNFYGSPSPKKPMWGGDDSEVPF